MKRSTLLAVAVTFLALAGCASTGGPRVANRYGADVDTEKVLIVNQWAQTKGATVVWINFPQKLKTAESASAVN